MAPPALAAALLYVAAAAPTGRSPFSVEYLGVGAPPSAAASIPVSPPQPAPPSQPAVPAPFTVKNLGGGSLRSSGGYSSGYTSGYTSVSPINASPTVNSSNIEKSSSSDGTVTATAVTGVAGVSESTVSTSASDSYDDNWWWGAASPLFEEYKPPELNYIDEPLETIRASNSSDATDLLTGLVASESDGVATSASSASSAAKASGETSAVAAGGAVGGEAAAGGSSADRSTDRSNGRSTDRSSGTYESEFDLDDGLLSWEDYYKAAAARPVSVSVSLEPEMPQATEEDMDVFERKDVVDVFELLGVPPLTTPTTAAPPPFNYGPMYGQPFAFRRPLDVESAVERVGGSSAGAGGEIAGVKNETTTTKNETTTTSNETTETRSRRNETEIREFSSDDSSDEAVDSTNARMVRIRSCPPNYKVDNDKCIGEERTPAKMFCPPTAEVQGEDCVAQQMPFVDCPAGYDVVKNECRKREVTPADAKCPNSNYSLDKETMMCTRKDEGEKGCPKGSKVSDDGKKCVKKVDKTKQCEGEGYVLSTKEDKCVKQELKPADAVCPKGAKLVNVPGSSDDSSDGAAEESKNDEKKGRNGGGNVRKSSDDSTAVPEHDGETDRSSANSNTPMCLIKKSPPPRCPNGYDFSKKRGGCIKSVERVEGGCPDGYKQKGRTCEKAVVLKPEFLCPLDHKLDQKSFECISSVPNEQPTCPKEARPSKVFKNKCERVVPEKFECPDDATPVGSGRAMVCKIARQLDSVECCAPGFEIKDGKCVREEELAAALECEAGSCWRTRTYKVAYACPVGSDFIDHPTNPKCARKKKEKRPEKPSSDDSSDDSSDRKVKFVEKLNLDGLKIHYKSNDDGPDLGVFENFRKLQKQRAREEQQMRDLLSMRDDLSSDKSSDASSEARIFEETAFKVLPEGWEGVDRQLEEVVDDVVTNTYSELMSEEEDDGSDASHSSEERKLQNYRSNSYGSYNPSSSYGSYNYNGDIYGGNSGTVGGAQPVVYNSDTYRNVIDYRNNPIARTTTPAPYKPYENPVYDFPPSKSNYQQNGYNNLSPSTHETYNLSPYMPPSSGSGPVSAKSGPSSTGPGPVSAGPGPVVPGVPYDPSMEYVDAFPYCPEGGFVEIRRCVTRSPLPPKRVCAAGIYDAARNACIRRITAPIKTECPAGSTRRGLICLTFESLPPSSVCRATKLETGECVDEVDPVDVPQSGEGGLRTIKPVASCKKGALSEKSGKPICRAIERRPINMVCPKGAVPETQLKLEKEKEKQRGTDDDEPKTSTTEKPTSPPTTSTTTSTSTTPAPTPHPSLELSLEQDREEEFKLNVEDDSESIDIDVSEDEEDDEEIDLSWGRRRLQGNKNDRNEPAEKSKHDSSSDDSSDDNSPCFKTAKMVTPSPVTKKLPATFTCRDKNATLVGGTQCRYEDSKPSVERCSSDAVESADGTCLREVGEAYEKPGDRATVKAEPFCVEGKLKGTRCVVTRRRRPTVTCPAGMELAEGRMCTKFVDKEAVCPKGATLDGEECVKESVLPATIKTVQGQLLSERRTI